MSLLAKPGPRALKVLEAALFIGRDKTDLRVDPSTEDCRGILPWTFLGEIQKNWFACKQFRSYLYDGSRIYSNAGNRGKFLSTPRVGNFLKL